MSTPEISTLKVGKNYTNNEIMSVFKVANSGGIRYSKTTKSIVIFSFNQIRNIKDVPYQDTWQANTIQYTGQGKSGDQTLSRNNKLLADSIKNNVSVYLFEAFTRGENRYQGRVCLVDKPYQIKEVDSDNQERQVYKFPLRLLNTGTHVSSNELMEHEKKQSTALDGASTETLKKIAIEASRLNSELAKEGHMKTASSRKAETEVFIRNPAIASYVKQLANGVCALCNKPAPFKDKNNKPFLHAHHIEYLSDGGLDVLENCIAVCPNCHARIHILNNSLDKEKLIQKVKSRLL
jgi:5-methylcytosine-specific restriction protein A